jgi:ParB family chromosome partitioning protein
MMPIKVRTELLASYEKENRQEKVVELDTKLLEPNPYQPRIEFDEETIKELAASIKEYGQLQPAVVCKRDDGKKGYFIVAGERRWRACKKEALPLKCVVKPAMDIRMLQIAAFQENVMRDELHPVEVSLAMQRLVETKVVLDWDEFEAMAGFTERSVGRFKCLVNLCNPAMRQAITSDYRNLNVLEALSRRIKYNNQTKVLQKIIDDRLGEELALRHIKEVADTEKEPKVEEPLSAKITSKGKATFTWKPSITFEDAPKKFQKFQQELQEFLIALEAKYTKKEGA